MTTVSTAEPTGATGPPGGVPSAAQATTSAAVHRALLGVFAEFERETIIDRVTSGMNTKAAKGKWVGGKLPYGYNLDPDTHKLVPNPAETVHVEQIYAWYTRDRLGTRAIANLLNGKAVTTRSGKPWSGYMIGRVLANPAYAGDISHGSIYVRDAHPPIIDPILQVDPSTTKSSAEPDPPQLLAGIW